MRRWLILLGVAGSAACGQHYIAEVALASLGEVCTSTAACAVPLVCDASSTCQPGHAVPLGGICVITADCAADLYCDEGSCAPSGNLVVDDTCASTADCTAGLVCAFAGMGGRCAVDGTAYVGANCASGACMAGLQCDPYAQTCVTLWPQPSGDGCDHDSLCDTEVGFFCDVVAGVCRGPGPDGIPVPGWPGATAGATGGSFRVLFEVPGSATSDFYRLPYPNDARVQNGHIDLSGYPVPTTSSVSAPMVERVVSAVESELTGFGPNETAFFRFSEAPFFCAADCGHDGGAACPDGCMGRYETKPSVYAVDLTAGPRFGSLNPVSFSWQASTGPQLYLPAPWLAYAPASRDPWEPGHTYAVLVHARVLSSAGDAMTQDADFVAMLRATAPTDARLARAYAAYAPLRGWLATSPAEADATSIGASDLGAAAVFTVREPTDLGARLVTAATADGVPTVSSVTLCAAAGAECSDPASEVFYEVQGRVSLPIFQRGEAPYLDDGGDLELDASGDPQIVRHEDVRFVLTLPKTTPPVTGWPVVLYAHGTGGSWREAVTEGLAEGLVSIDVVTSTTTEHFAVLTLETVAHGARRGGSVADPATLFFNLANPQAAKGNLAQAAVDELGLVRALAPIEVALAGVATLPTTTLDVSRVAIVGRTGGALAAVLGLVHAGAPDVAVLAGVDALLVQYLTARTAPFDYANAVRLLLGEQATPAAREHPVLSLLQGYWDDVDATNFAPHLVGDPLAGGAARDLLQVVGVGDTWVPNAASLLFARRAGSDYLDDGDSGILTGGVDIIVTPPVSGNDVGTTNVTSIHPPEAGAAADRVLFDRTADGAANPVPAYARMREFLGSWWAAAGGAPSVAN
ncbi:MAG: hypothetical protein AAB426_11690 [Myxococcota bacterium]|mgnify:CR=1 FL=1